MFDGYSGAGDREHLAIFYDARPELRATFDEMVAAPRAKVDA
jgi:hypothetical protein